MAAPTLAPEQIFLADLMREEQYYQCLLQLQEQMQDHLIHNSQAELEQVIQQQEQCLALMQAREKERQTRLKPWNGQLSVFIAQLPDLRLRTQFKVLQEKINTHVAALRSLRAKNQVLLEQGLMYIQHTTELYRSLACANTPAVYSPYGQVETRAESHASFCEYNA